MKDFQFISTAHGDSSFQSKSIFGAKPAERLVKEVVSFRPAPSNSDAIREAQRRLAAGESIFAKRAPIGTVKRG